MSDQDQTEQEQVKELSPKDRLLELRSLAIELGPSPTFTKMIDHINALLGSQE